MKIDSKLIKLKIHYFFIMAGTAPIVPLMPVYIVAHLGLSYNGLGFVYTVLPFVGLFAKALSGSLSDLFHCHRAVFLSSIAVTAAAYFSIFFLEPIPLDATNNIANITFDCSDFSYLRYNLPYKTCGNYDKLNLTEFSTCEIVCNNSSEEIEYICKSWNIAPSDCLGHHLQFSASVDMSGYDLEQNSAFFPVQNVSVLNSEIADPQCFQLTHLSCTAKCDKASLMSYMGAPIYAPAYSYAGFMVHYQFWLFFCFIIIAYSGYSIAVVMTDTVCFQNLGDAPHKYGKQRLWGSIGWGSSAILTGLVIDATSASISNTNYAAMFYMTFFILAVDCVIATRLKVNLGERAQIEGKMVFKALYNGRSALFVVCCIIMGLSTGVMWIYLLILAQNVAYKWDCNFEHMKLLQGLIQGVQCFGGELPFFFISGIIIKKLGHVHAMSVAILAFGLRFVSYSFVRNPWMFLPLELFSGFTFGIFYSVMTTYAHIIAPPGAQATLQGIFGASFEGLGVAIGAFVGAALFNTVSEANAFLYIGIFNIVFAICHFTLQLIISKINQQGRPSIADGYILPGENTERVVD